MTALIGFDWGTTNLRAALLDAEGNVLEQRVAESGVGSLDRDGFAARFDEQVAGWPALPAVLAGMVGSAQGWRDAGYAPAPARTDDLAERMVTFRHGGRPIAIVPGISLGGIGLGGAKVEGKRPDVMRGEETDGDRVDVMRGEETQIAGLLARRPHFAGTVVLPGTHSKWVRVENGVVRSFHTYMTGDLFDAIGQRTILRHSVGVGAASPDLFREAFLSAFERGRSVWGQLFAIRAATILEDATPAEGREKLSGFLIGAEFAAARSDDYLTASADRLTLVGSGALVERYREATRLAGIDALAYQGTPLVWSALVMLAKRRSLI